MQRICRAGAVGLFMAVLLQAHRVEADMHLVQIDELMAGANGNSNIQFVELTMLGLRQNCQGTGNVGSGPFNCDTDGPGARLVFFDAAGNQIAEFIFPSNTPIGEIGRSILIATQQFADLRTTPKPDFIMLPHVRPTSGKICYKNRPNALFFVNQCLSYGSFTGDTEGFGTPAAALPATGNVSLKRVNSGFNNSTSFTLSTPSPRNNCGEVSRANRCPVANAGPDQTVAVGALVTLDGAASNDPDGDTLTFSWSLTAGPSVTLSGVDTATPTFTAPPVGLPGGLLTFQLTVTDPGSLSSNDTVNVRVASTTPANLVARFYPAVARRRWGLRLRPLLPSSMLGLPPLPGSGSL